jgi:two-component system, OmpR family, copper resistance phosphate regulon response regulator CusR
MRLLLVEDEKKTGQYLRKGLTENGFIVDLCQDGLEGLALARSGRYELMVLDINLPGCDGWTLLKTLRSEGIQSPALFLTAKDAVQDRVRGLELGADDYLIKPFAFSELLARLRTILRRGKTPADDLVQISDLAVNLRSHTASRAGKNLLLSQKEFALLSLLVRKKNEVLSRAVISDQIWDINFDSATNVVDVTIGRLRSKVDASPSEKLIHTVRGAGYVLKDPN